MNEKPSCLCKKVCFFGFFEVLEGVILKKKGLALLQFGFITRSGRPSEVLLKNAVFTQLQLEMGSARENNVPNSAYLMEAQQAARFSYSLRGGFFGVNKKTGTKLVPVFL
jgi:hypothetical protein